MFLVWSSRFSKSWNSERLCSDPRCQSTRDRSKFQNCAWPLFWIAACYTGCYGNLWKSFWTTTCSTRKSSRSFWKFNGVRPKITEQRMTQGLKVRLERQDSTNSKTILHSCGGILLDFFAVVRWIKWKFQSRKCFLEKFPDSMDFQGWRSASRLKFVQKQLILKSQCSGSQNLRKQVRWRIDDSRIDSRAKRIPGFRDAWFYESVLIEKVSQLVNNTFCRTHIFWTLLKLFVSAFPC